jgi:hypothetical protein
VRGAVNWAKLAAPLVRAGPRRDALSQIECKTCAEGSASGPSERLRKPGKINAPVKRAHIDAKALKSHITEYRRQRRDRKTRPFTFMKESLIRPIPRTA